MDQRCAAASLGISKLPNVVLGSEHQNASIHRTILSITEIHGNLSAALFFFFSIFPVLVLSTA
jgi:hypothetical protein